MTGGLTLTNLQANMEYGSKTGNGADCCTAYPWQYPLEAGNPYRQYQMEMYYRPYRDQDYWLPCIMPYGYGWCYPWRGVLPPPGTCPIGHSYSWSTSTEGARDA